MRKEALVLILLFSGFYIFAQNGTIRELSGTVELKNAGTSAFVPAKNGDSVNQDTVISTGFKSSALVELGNTLITVKALTRLTLTEIRAASGTETINVNLQAGRVRVDLNPPSGTRAVMTVKSPIATASVRGTSFEFDTRNLYVNNGTVSFRGNRGSSMMVGTGYSSNINENDKAADPLDVKNAKLRPKAPGNTDSGEGGYKPASSPPQSSSGDFSVEIIY